MSCFPKNATRTWLGWFAQNTTSHAYRGRESWLYLHQPTPVSVHYSSRTKPRIHWSIMVAIVKWPIIVIPVTVVCLCQAFICLRCCGHNILSYILKEKKRREVKDILSIRSSSPKIKAFQNPNNPLLTHHNIGPSHN